jgi:pilus biogenesis lipoprotein CpaD
MPLKPLTLLAAGAALLGLAACSEALPDPRQPKQPVVTQVTSLHAVRFAPEGVEVSEAERQRLLNFLAEMRLRESDRVLVELPAGAAGSDVATRRALALMELLGRNGVAAKPFTPNESGARVIRVGVERIGLNAPADCPEWPEFRDLEAFVNDVHPNYGCATANNFAVMLANPRDAVEGRALGPADAERLSRGVAAYRQGLNLPFESLPYSSED